VSFRKASRPSSQNATTPASSRSRIEPNRSRCSSSARFVASSSAFAATSSARRRRSSDGHRVERARERADLVAALDLDERVEVARADAARRRRERRDRARDAPREEEADPDGREEHEEREEKEEQDLDGFERGALGLQHRVGARRARELAERLGLGGRVVRADEERPGRRDEERTPGLPAVARRLDPARDAPRLRVGDPVRTGVVDLPDRPARRAHGGGRSARPAPLEIVDARFLPCGREKGEEVPLGCGREPREEPVGRAALEGRGPEPHEVGDLAPRPDRVLHGRREPALDALLQEARRREDQERDREEGEPDVGRDDPHAEARAEDAAPRLEDQLDAVPDEDEQEHEDEDDDDVEQDEQQDAIRRGGRREVAGLEDERVTARERRAEREADREKDPVVARPPVRRDGRHGLRQRTLDAVHSKIPDRAQSVSSLVGITPSATPSP
jgi:hypothetical protein